MKLFYYPLIVTSLFSLLSLHANEQVSKTLGASGSWRIHQTSGTGGCFVSTKPNKSEGAYKKRDPIYFLINFSGTKATPQFVAGYPVQDKGKGKITIDQEAFDLHLLGDAGWLLDNDEPKLIAAMKKGKEMLVESTSLRGTATKDVFSLSGLSKALMDAPILCAGGKIANPVVEPSLKVTVPKTSTPKASTSKTPAPANPKVVTAQKTPAAVVKKTSSVQPKANPNKKAPLRKPGTPAAARSSTPPSNKG